MSGRTPGAERLYRARRAAAKELGVKANDPRAIRLATLQCAHDSAQAQLAGGRTVDIDSLLKLDAALAQARAAAGANTKPDAPKQARGQRRRVRPEYKPRFPYGRSDQRRGLGQCDFRTIPRCLLASLSEE